MVRETWSSEQKAGWGGILLKNKLRKLKLTIKQWSKEYGNISIKEIQKTCKNGDLRVNYYFVGQVSP